MGSAPIPRSVSINIPGYKLVMEEGVRKSLEKLESALGQGS